MSPDYRSALLLTAQALPPGAAVPVVRETLIEILTGNGGQAQAPDAPPADFTVAQVAARFGRNPSTVRGWILSGQLTAYRFRNRELRVRAESIAAFEAAQRQTASKPPRSSRPTSDLSAWRRTEA